MRLKSLLLAFILALAVLPAAYGQTKVVTTGNLPANWKQSLVRINSHGLSGTVIATGPGWSLILSSAHGWLENGDRTKKAITIDVPFSDTQVPPKSSGSPKLVAINADVDLALVELPAGPMPCFIPVAKAGTQIGDTVRSAGYDEMRWTDGPLIKEATVLNTDGRTIFTREIPWHGRSGGILLDATSATLIGVVQGYQTDPARGTKGPGMYVSAKQVRTFLAKAGVKELSQDLKPIQYGDPDSDWKVDPRGGAKYRGGLSPGAAPDLPPGIRIRVEESPDCPNGQCRPSPQTPNFAPPRLYAPQGYPGGSCPGGQCRPSESPGRR